jgi:hypothetical protein
LKSPHCWPITLMLFTMRLKLLWVLDIVLPIR